MAVRPALRERDNLGVSVRLKIADGFLSSGDSPEKNVQLHDTFNAEPVGISLADMHESVADNELRRLGNEGCNVHFSGSPLATSERADGADAKVSQRLPNTVIDLRAHNSRAHPASGRSRRINALAAGGFVQAPDC
jgi:hypothetical protein